jgi:UDP-2-acetamido-3-amino-2,3-dideoxy-glucuronate N-acetyltransferase
MRADSGANGGRRVNQGFVHPTAVVDDGVGIGADTRIWHFCHVSSGAQIGARCVLGQNVFVGAGVRIGDGVKVQNNVSIYAGVEVEADAFLGPSCVFTNVLNPRAFVERKHMFELTRVGRGASVGANATIVCGNNLGPYCLVGAGAVVVGDVAAHAVVVGNPARQIGWVCRCGERLEVPHPVRSAVVKTACDACGDRYRISEAGCVRLD